MLEEYLKNNLFVKGVKAFSEGDPHLSILRDLKFVHPMDWWDGIDWQFPGIYILTGGRQIGKTTSTKLLIKHAIMKKLFSPERIFYLPCDQIDDYHHLFRTIALFLEEMPGSDGSGFLLIIDEITFVREWDRAIKALADDGSLRGGFCILTGSDSIVLKDAASRFSGRRGGADTADFHIHPLNFHDYVKLTNPRLLDNPEGKTAGIFDSFREYQKCGGYLKAINDLHIHGEIRKATYLTFEQWIRSDFERRNKNTDVLLGVLKTIYESAGSQVSLSSLAHKMGQVVKETFNDYVSLLERMDVIFSLQAFDQNSGLAFPKKARKIHFADPFIFDTVGRWLAAERRIALKDTEPEKVEAIVASNYQRAMPTYYIKAEGEIDVVVVTGKSFVPLEIKWAGHLRQHDLKQLLKYRRSVILTKGMAAGAIEGVSVVPLPLFLVKFPVNM